MSVAEKMGPTHVRRLGEGGYKGCSFRFRVEFPRLSSTDLLTGCKGLKDAWGATKDASSSDEHLEFLSSVDSC